MIFLSHTQNTKRLFAIAFGVYVLFAALVFGRLTDHRYELDDLAYLQDLTQISQHPSTIFSPERKLPGRPVTDVALLSVYLIFGDNPAAFHLAVVLAHLLATMLLTLTFYKSGFSEEQSITGGFLFLINLAHFRAVQWISCLAYPLALGFGCLGMLAYFAYQNNNQQKWYLLSIVSFILAIFSHPAAIAFPIFTAYLIWQKKQNIQPILITIAIAIVCLIALLKSFPNVPQSEHATAAFQWHVIDLIRHFFWYLGRLWTSTLIVFPTMSDIYTGDLIAGIIALIGIGLLFYKRQYPTAHWGVWMLLGLAVFITNPNQTHFESGPSRHLYFASAGSAIILAYACQLLSQKLANRIQQHSVSKISFIALLFLITGLSIYGLRKSEAFGYILSARTFLVTNQKEQATHHFEKAVQTAPEFVSSAMYEQFLIANLAEGKYLIESLHQARAHYPDNPIITAIRMIYGFQSDTIDHQHVTERIVTFAQEHDKNTQKFIAIACLNLGYYYTTQSQKNIAETLFLGALQIQPDYPEASIYLARLYSRQQKIDAARRLLENVIQNHSDHEEALRNLGDIYVSQKAWDKAIDVYQKMRTIHPHAKDVLFKLGYLYLSQKNYAEARPIFVALSRQMPDNWQAFAYLGQCLHAEGQFQAARVAYEKALQLNPDEPALQTLIRQVTPNN